MLPTESTDKQNDHAFQRQLAGQKKYKTLNIKRIYTRLMLEASQNKVMSFE